MTFARVPDDKKHLLSEEEKAQLVDYKNPENNEKAPNYGDVITREEATVVEKPPTRKTRNVK
jgi:hypothetical protein